MANLSGEYDVAIEAGVGLINAILGAVHENQDTNFPVMPRSLSMFLDDTPRGPTDPIPASSRTGVQSRVEIQVSTPIVSLPVDVLQVRPEFLGRVVIPGAVPAAGTSPTAGSSPTGGEPDVGAAFSVRGPLGDVFVPPFALAPRLQAKLSIRAWVRDPTGDRLPEFVHGDLFITSNLVRSEVVGVGTFVTLDRTNGPQVAFQPASGTTVSDEQRQTIVSIVRNAIRGDMEPPTFRVALPAEIRIFDFKLLNEARRPAIQLLLVLSDHAVRANARDTVPGGLLPDGADFSVAVGRSFVVDILRTSLTGFPESISASKSGFCSTVELNPPVFDLTSGSFGILPGRIVMTITGRGSVGVCGGPQDSFTFTIRQGFGLRIAGTGLEPVAAGDPEVDVGDVDVPGGTGFIEDKIRDTVIQERDAALAANADQFRKSFDVGGQIDAILRGVNPKPPGVALTGAEISSDGILVTGTVGLAASAPVVAGQVVRAGFNDALQSAIPGGIIDRFVWDIASRFIPASTRVDEHRFVTELIPVISIFDTLCVRVEGRRVAAGGELVPVSGSACLDFAPVIQQVQGVTSGPRRPLLPLTRVEDGRVRVIGHFDPWAPGRAPAGGNPNLLLYFGGEGAAEVLRQGVEWSRESEAAIVPIAVLPAGGLREWTPADDVLPVEDPEDQWAQAFGVSPPACVLIGPGGDVAWKEEAAPDPKSLAAALDRYAKRGGEVSAIPIRLAVQVGARPPDVRLRLGDGSELSLRRLKGRPVALTFVTSRSEPSLDQLDVLRDLHATRGSAAPLIVAVGDEESPERVAEIVKERNLPFLVVPDTDRFIARAFGVWCWPATVWIRADQLVEAVDFGVSAPVVRPNGPRRY